MYAALVDHLIAEVSAHTYDSKRALRFFKGCEKESDRATPVLIVSFIEDAIKELFSAHLSASVPGGVSALFDPMGPLATTSSRLKMLAAIGWISLKTAQDLDIARKIRNEFAHNPPDEGFYNQKIRSLVGKLSPYEAPLITPEAIERIQLRPITTEEIRPRLLFVARTGAAFFCLVEELLTMPRALRIGLPATAALAYDRDKMPQNLKESRESMIRVILETIYADIAD